MVPSVFAFIFGAIVGSFLNVCICRVPQGKSIVRPGSHCPACNHSISFYDNIPFFSYLLLKGRCRHCGTAISPRYLVVELLTALLFLALYRTFGLTSELGVYMAFVALLIVISFIDLDLQIIPDVLSLGGLLLGLALSFVRTPFSYKQGFLGVLLGGGILFLIAAGYQFFAKREGMGGGDIKLLAMIGAFCGIQGVIFTLVVGSFAGALVGIPLMLAKEKDTKYAVPFGPFLSLGAIVYVLIGEAILYGYIHLVTGI
jgi:leader peptidase (prepilin peptidase) / N-methyltransferase